MQVCKHFVKNGSCNKGNSCSYQHILGVCYHFFMKSSCKYGSNCHLLHSYTLKKNEGLREGLRDGLREAKPKRNTESFVPSDKPADMRMIYTTVKNGEESNYKKEFHSRDVFVVNDLFPDFSYDLLLREINESGEYLFKLWHGDSHLIADDHSRVDWKGKCPTFRKVIERIKTYFNMDVKATRFNLYRDGSDWKPLHFDSAAVDPKKAATQNTTIGVSFGRTRDAIFEHATTRTTVALPLENGAVYGFGSVFNREWRHGITQLSATERERDDSGRISIICWGWVDEKE
jgi:hypothetical protein